jgi:hypothetical protein
MSPSGPVLPFASLKQWEADQTTLTCSLCSTIRERGLLTAIVFEYNPKNAKRYKEHTTPESRLDVCLFVCTTDAELDAACKAKALPLDLRERLRKMLGEWHPNENRFAGEQIELVIKATHRMLSAADGNAIRIIDLEQLCCYVCHWEMKPAPELRAQKAEMIWVLFEADKVKWFCDSFPCRQAIKEGKHESLMSKSCLTIPEGTELGSILSELRSRLPSTTVFTASVCGASVADTCPWKLPGTL